MQNERGNSYTETTDFHRFHGRRGLHAEGIPSGDNCNSYTDFTDLAQINTDGFCNSFFASFALFAVLSLGELCVLCGF